MYAKDGFVLLEVLVAIFIVAFCGLGMMRLQLRAWQGLKNAYYQSIAVQQLLNKFEQLDSGDSACEPWNSENQMLLPQGIGYCEATGITVCWLGFLNTKQCLSAR